MCTQHGLACNNLSTNNIFPNLFLPPLNISDGKQIKKQEYFVNNGIAFSQGCQLMYEF